MRHSIFNFFIILVFAHVRSSVNRAHATNHIPLDIDENLVLKICEKRFCTDAGHRDCNLDFCLRQMSAESKLGDCASDTNRSESGSDTTCYDDCDGQDYRCSGAEKCCWNNCNRSCVVAENIDKISNLNLPAIPMNVTVSSVEHDMRRKAQVSWQMRSHQSDYGDLVDYIIEARAHIGSTFSHHKLSPWFVAQTDHFHPEQRLPESTHFRIKSVVPLKIGRWYEFRVIAFNGNGTRGYSMISAPFQLIEKPKQLPSPTNFTIEIPPKLLTNNSVYTRVTWKSSTSDFPIEKYEFTWSLFIGEGDGSLFMEKALVSESRRFFEFWDLLPDAYYYLQVRAISSFGRKRIKSEKLSIFLNTTDVYS